LLTGAEWWLLLAVGGGICGMEWGFWFSAAWESKAKQVSETGQRVFEFDYYMNYLFTRGIIYKSILSSELE
jgi:hypothetical protein